MATETMKAFVITAPQTGGVQQIARWVPAPGEVLVRSRAVAVCTLERRIFAGAAPRYPVIGGHELAGVVEWVDGDQPGLKPGDRVAVDVMRRCGHCRYCRQGSNNICVEMNLPRRNSEFAVVGGGFAEYVAIPARQAIKLPEDLDLGAASLIEPLACCLHSIKRARVAPGDTVAVFGAGTMGVLHVLLARHAGARTIAIDPDEARLDFARRLGADFVLDPGSDDPARFVKDRTEGHGADVVIVAAGSMTAGEQALETVARTGRIVLYASLQPTAPLPLDWNMVHYKEIVVTGSANNTDADFREAAGLVSDRAVDLQPLVSRRIDLDELSGELLSSPRGKTQRVVVQL